jgi:hypothetical protein
MQKLHAMDRFRIGRKPECDTDLSNTLRVSPVADSVDACIIYSAKSFCIDCELKLLDIE